VDKFTSYDDAITWLKSIDGHVGPVQRQADALDSVTVFGAHGLTRTGTFDTGLRESPRHKRDYREAVCLACCELHEAMQG
jgi:hypothetical protein